MVLQVTAEQAQDNKYMSSIENNTDMKHDIFNTYESPCLGFLEMETEGFICSSRLTVMVDEHNSFWGDSSMKDSSGNQNGDLIFE